MGHLETGKLLHNELLTHRWILKLHSSFLFLFSNINYGFMYILILDDLQNMMQEDMKRVKKYGKVFGMFEGVQPAIYISDPEIIKQILVKDFDHFVNHPVSTYR